MENGKKESQPEQVQPPVSKSCRTKKSDPDASFIQDVKDHFQDFVSASMEDHKNCFMNTFGKMFGKVPKEDSASTSDDSVLATSSK